MYHLPSLICPGCSAAISGIALIDKVSVATATRFETCLRRCEPCKIGVSNASDDPTYIHLDPLGNIPIECRAGVIEVLGQALNERNREPKRFRFGFSTSEDAVTWVVFTYLSRTGHLLAALRRIGLIPDETAPTAPALLLWGVPVDNHARGTEIRKQLSVLCARLQEDRNSFSEPDVIIDLGEAGLVFIEVKHPRGKNECKQADYSGWSKYASVGQLDWRFEDVKASGCYELARNWCLLKNLAADRPASLMNLGPAKLFRGAEGARLDRFVTALGTDKQSRFRKLTWSEFLGKDLGDAPDWFNQFCRSRSLMA